MRRMAGQRISLLGRFVGNDEGVSMRNSNLLLRIVRSGLKQRVVG